MAKKQAPKASKRPRVADVPPPPADLSHIVEGLRPLAFPVADLVPDAGNARSHDDDNLTAIAASLRQFGQTQAIVAQRESRLVLAGHGRLEAAQRLYAAGDLRWSQMAVVFVEWDSVRGLAYAIADNRTAELAEWDKDALEKQLRQIEVGDEDLSQMLADLATDLDLLVEADEEETADPVPERFTVVVKVANREAQSELIERLQVDGYECRAASS